MYDDMLAGGSQMAHSVLRAVTLGQTAFAATLPVSSVTLLRLVSKRTQRTKHDRMRYHAMATSPFIAITYEKEGLLTGHEYRV